MRAYSRLGPTFWTGETGRALRRRGIEAPYVALFLISAPMSNMLGVYPCSIPAIMESTGLTEEGASKGLRACVEEGFCSFDADLGMVWVHEMAAWQIAEQLAPGDKRGKGIQTEYEKLPENPFLGAWFDRYEHAFHLTRRRTYQPRKLASGQWIQTSPIEAPSMPHRSQAQAQEQAQEQDQAGIHPERARSGVIVAQGETLTAAAPPPAEPEPDPPTPTAAGTACRVMRQAGLADTNPASPKLLRLLQQGMTLPELEAAAKDAVKQQKGFAWALSAAAGRREDAAKVMLAPPIPKPSATVPSRESEATRQTIAELAEAMRQVQTPTNRAARLEAMAKIRPPRGTTA